jgi:hypothetical protein
MPRVRRSYTGDYTTPYTGRALTSEEQQAIKSVVVTLVGLTDPAYLSARKQLHWQYIRNDVGIEPKPLKDPWLAPLVKFDAFRWGDVLKIFRVVEGQRATRKAKQKREFTEAQKEARRLYQRQYQRKRRLDQRRGYKLKPGDEVFIMAVGPIHQAPAGLEGWVTGYNRKEDSFWVELKGYNKIDVYSPRDLIRLDVFLADKEAVEAANKFRAQLDLEPLRGPNPEPQEQPQPVAS